MGKIVDAWEKAMASRHVSDEEVESTKANWSRVRRGKWLTPPTEAKRAIAAQYQRGESAAVLGELYGVSGVTISAWIKEVGQAIRTGSQSARQRPMRRRYALNEASFDQINEHSAYWIGFLMADGNVGPRVKGQQVLYLGLGEKDEQHVRKFAAFLGTDKPIETRYKGDRKDGSPINICCVQISSDRIVDSLSKYGVVPKKSLTASVRGLEMNRDFWRGVVDGDGCLRFTSNSPNLVLCGSKNLTCQFYEFCVSLGVEMRESFHRPSRGNVWIVCLCGEKAAKVISCLYSESAVHLDRKKATADEITEWAQSWSR